MLSDTRGDAAVEWLVIASIAVVLLGVAAYAIASKASTEGGAVASWIDGLDVPSSP